MNKKNITSGLLLLLGFAILGYLLYDFGFDNILTNIKKTGWWFAPVIGVYFFVFLQNAYVWYLIIDDKEKKLSFWEVFSYKISGMAINDITPVVNLGGEPYKIYSIKKQVGTSKAVSSVILYTMIHWLSHFFIWITAILVISFTADLSDFIRWFLFGTFIVISVLIYLFYRRHKKGIFISFLNKISKIPFLKGLADKLSKSEDTFVQIDEQIKNLYSERPWTFFWSLLLDYGGRLIAAVEFYFILQAINYDISLLNAFYIYAGYTLLVNIMFFMPLQLGTREASLIMVMEILKVATGSAVFVSLVMRIRELVWVFIGLILIQINKVRTKDDKKMSDFMKMDTGQK